MCCDPRCSKLRDADFPNLSSPPRSPGDPSPQRDAAARRATRRSTSSSSRAPKCSEGESLTANSQRGAIPSPGLEEIGLPSGSSVTYSRFPAPASPPPGPSPPGWAAASPRYLRRSRARPRSARRNPNPCCELPAGRPQPPALPSAGRSGSASGLRLPRRTRCGQPGGGSPGGAGWAMRGGHGRGSTPQRRAPPASLSPRPPAGACARSKRGAEGGSARGREREGEGRREQGGTGASGPAGSRPGLNTPGAAPLLLPAPRALDLRSAARSCRSARPSGLLLGANLGRF
ncbi:translation initiation factor IF-2-like [Acinonyx jubatus]|uniref:Translation initiation factor IF-2-like n=1 Tax=Acinonyx jubatus TaxID=32536 RepID=A0ABM3Q7T1_ACIJB|nr:translation initiation factor IF-2-like [Acinonyx jubatus]